MENSPALLSPTKRKSVIRWQFVLAGLLAIGFLVYFFQPGVSTWWLRRQLNVRAADVGCKMTFTKLEADFFAGRALLEGLQLNDEINPENQVRSAEVGVEFSPWRFIFQRDLSPIKKFTIGKTQVDWKWQTEKTTKSKKIGAIKVFRNRFPDAVSGNSISAALVCGNARMEIANADFSFQPNAAGEIDIPQLIASLGSWKRTFNNLEGVTAIKDRALYVGGIKFTPDLVLERGALDFTRPDKQKITSDLLFTAFGGNWRTDLDLDRRKLPGEIDLAASFWNLSVEKLGEFVGNQELAEGLIHEGRITYHGNPNEPAKSNTTLRLNATDFRWHERQWNSLVASALLVNRRIEIPQFDLVQDKNQIQIKGHAALPAQWTRLPSEFQLQVLAQIDDLHSAAMLVLPGQKGIDGEAFFAGEVRNQNGQFSGNLKMRGGPLQISGVAVDRVRGDLDLRGSEVSATALELVRRDDKAAGWATLNLAEPRRYSGEFEVTAKDIADYAAFLPKSVATYANAGGAKLWWSGDGTDNAHSGAFKVNLQNFFVSNKPDAVPVDVESHGSYSPAGVTFNHLTLTRPNTRIDAAIVVRPDSMELRDLHLTGSGNANISGNITLPINLFAAIGNPTLAALLDSKAAATGKIIGNKVRLDELSELVGRRQPWRGRINFELGAEGSIEHLQARLQIGLEDFFGPENLAIPSLKADWTLAENDLALLANINADEPRDSVSLQLNARTTLSQTNLDHGQWLDLDSPLAGTLQGNRVALEALYRWWPAARPFKGDIGAVLKIGGTPRVPVFEGNLTLQNTEWQPPWLGYPLQKLIGNVILARDRITTDKVNGTYRGGSFTASGTTGLTPADPVDLQIIGKTITLSSSTEASEAIADGSIRLQGSSEERSISGTIQLRSAVIRRELSLTAPEVLLPPIHRFALPWVSPNWTVDLEVAAEHPLQIRGRETAWLVQPTLLFSGTARAPLLAGSLVIRPMALLKNTSEESRETKVNFSQSPLEEGVVSEPISEATAELAPSPAIEYGGPLETPAEDGPAVRRLQVNPTDESP